MTKPIVVIHPEKTLVTISEETKRQALDAAMWVTASPHEWVWTPEQQAAMAIYALWAHQRLSGIAQLASSELDRA